MLPGCNGDVKRPTTGVLGWKSAVEACGCIVVAEVGVGYAEVVGYGVAVLSCGVDVGLEAGVETGMPRAFSEELGIGAECRCVLISVCDDGSDLVG